MTHPEVCICLTIISVNQFIVSPIQYNHSIKTIMNILRTYYVLNVLLNTIIYYLHIIRYYVLYNFFIYLIINALNKVKALDNTK